MHYLVFVKDCKIIEFCKFLDLKKNCFLKHTEYGNKCFELRRNSLSCSKRVYISIFWILLNICCVPNHCYIFDMNFLCHSSENSVTDFIPFPDKKQRNNQKLSSTICSIFITAHGSVEFELSSIWFQNYEPLSFTLHSSLNLAIC